RRGRAPRIAGLQVESPRVPGYTRSKEKGTERDNSDARHSERGARHPLDIPWSLYCPSGPSSKRAMPPRFIPPHGGYKQLLSYQRSEIVFDATVHFCNRFVSLRSRTHD